MNNFCQDCGSPNREGAKFCLTCGKPLEPSAPPAPVVDSAPSAASAIVLLQPVPPAASQPGNGVLHSLPAAETPVPVALPAVSSDVSGTPSAGLPPAIQALTTDAPTAPLSLPSFAALPEGELLDERRYLVMAVLSSSQRLNVYQILDQERRYCRQCGSTENGIQDGYCANCGVTLPKDQVSFWLRETSELDMWERESLMAERRLWHQGLINIHRVFQDCPYGSLTRTYLVSDAGEGTVLASLPSPPPEEKVLAWGQQLAAAVSYLHSQGFRHRSIRAASVRLVGDQVKLTNFGKAEKVARAEDKDWPANDVADLARMLHDELLAGRQLSPETAAVFTKALSPDNNVRYATADALGADLTKAIESLQRVDSVAFVAGRRSHVGMARDHNEDSLLTLELQRVQLSESQAVGLYVVADGMGGQEAGEVASGVAINTVAMVITGALLSPWLDGRALPSHGDLLQEAFQKANQAVHERGRKAHTDMGTTLVGALLIGSEAFVANIGDSRCYRLSQGKLEQVTTDHSLVERLVAAGQITREEARVHPQRNYILRSVGAEPQVAADIFKVNLRPDDILVLCTDGLSGMVEDPHIQEAVLNSPNPQAACEKLIQLANAAGGDDNITVIAVQVVAANGNR